MDNLPRCDFSLIPDSEDWQLETFHHSYMSWIDATLQAAMNCEYLIMMAEELGITDDVDALRDEYDNLVRFVNEKMWSEKDGFYYDLKADGSFLAVKTVAAFWALIAKIAPPDRVDALCRHLEDKNEFNRPNRVPALSADHPDYKDNGGYWNGGVWAPTNYMVLCGLSANGKEKLAKDIAECCYQNAMEVYRKTGTFWENYAPETATAATPRARICRLDGHIPYNRFDRVHPRNQSLRRKVGDSLAREQARGARNKEAARWQGFVRHAHVQGEKIPRREARNNRRERQADKVKVIYGEDWQFSFDI